MLIRILGPLTVERAGRDVPVTSARLRTMLAYLLTHAGQLVTAEALIAEVWEDAPPLSATNTLQTYISQLRQLLEPDRPPGTEPRMLRTLPGGYLLDVETELLDHQRFENALRDGRATAEAADPERAAELLSEGLSLWRGAALVNVAGRAAKSEAARLDELRLTALELRIDANLACGRHDEVISELECLVREHPWRERFIGQLMLALYRCGRQADALASYRNARDLLLSELAIDPSPALQELERRILRQDAGLGPPGTGTVREPGTDRPAALTDPAAPALPATIRRRRRPPRAAVIIAGVAVIVVVLGVLATLRPNPGARGSGVQTAGNPVFNEFDLGVHPGMGYDLDIPPGQPADWHSTNNQRSPDYDFLDFYHTSSSVPEAENQISGVDLHNTNEYNAIHLVADTDPAAICHELPTRSGGNVKMRDLHVGSKVCLRTYDNRWALLTISRMPADRATVLLIHVTVLTS